MHLNIKYISICLILFLFAIPIHAEDKAASTNNDNLKQGNTKVNENILKKRFGDFSTSPIYVLIPIKNKATGESGYYIANNVDAFMMCKRHIKNVSTSKEYTALMVNDYGTPLEVDDQIFKAIKADLTGKYDTESKMGWDYIKNKYFLPGISLELKDPELIKDYDFLKMLLEQNVIVRSNCYTGKVMIYE